MEKLDKLDKKILFELDQNSRQTLSTLSKKLGASKQVLDYRIRRLQENKILIGFPAIIDHSKLGFFSFRIYMKFKSVSSKEEKEMVEYAMKKENIWWLVTIDGNWDLVFVILSKEVFDFYPVWEDFLSRYRKYILTTETTVYSHIEGFPKSYLVEKQNKEEGKIVSSKRREEKIDEIDFQILNELAQNSRKEIIEIAGKLKIDARTVTKRIKELENRKIIVGYRTLMDINKLGYRHYKGLFYLKNINNISKMNLFAKSHPNIIYINKTIGGCDYELEFHVKNIEEFHRVIDEFREQFKEDIDYYNYFRVIKEYKVVYYPKLEK